MSDTSGSSSPVRASPGYLASIALGCAGLAFLGIGLGGAVRGRLGGDPFEALNVDGIVMFLLGFAILFASRLIFWPPAPPSLRQMVRSAIALIFILGVLACFVSLILAFQLPSTLKNASMPLYFSGLAAPCQIASLIWLVSYRRDGI